MWIEVNICLVEDVLIFDVQESQSRENSSVGRELERDNEGNSRDVIGRLLKFM
jgi:hypothetical protein